MQGSEHRINIISDTPGHVDFTVEVERSLRVTGWRCRRISVQRAVLSRSLRRTYGAEVMSTESTYHVWPSSTRWTSWAETSTALSIRSGTRLRQERDLFIQLPIGKEDDFKGIVDLFEMQAYIYNDAR